VSADLLRRAAARVREVAEGHYPSPWEAFGTGVAHGDHWHVAHDSEAIVSISSQDGINEDQRQPLAEHIALWHPAVALAVADWLDSTARELYADMAEDEGPPDLRRAVALARLILGEPA
jgi:hypothetical protein